ncbi:MAG: SCO family protein [candidate division Zixibacteria bacterium]|nr:SCO family protein [candidate division Zixibacteria bacterium]
MMTLRTDHRPIHPLAAVLLLAGLYLFVFPQVVSAQVVMDSVAELQGIDVIEHPGDTIPLDLTFTNDQGEEVMLGDYFHNEKPVILTLSYTNCPMLCTVLLNGLTNGVRGLEWRPGAEYQMVNVSIDPLETVELTQQRKKRYLESVGPMQSKRGWAFLVGNEDNINALSDAVGFQYYYDEKQDMYAHPAVIFILTEAGVISRYLYGIEYAPRDLKLSLLEASEGKIGSTVDRIILYCFHYDPDAGGYVLFASNVMRLGGLVTLILLAVFLGTYWVRERVKSHHTHHAHASSVH